MSNNKLSPLGEIILYLFQVGVPTVNEHLKHIYEDGELKSDSTIRKFRIVSREGTREVAREIEYYDLDAILAVKGAVPCDMRFAKNRISQGTASFTIST